MKEVGDMAVDCLQYGQQIVPHSTLRFDSGWSCRWTLSHVTDFEELQFGDWSVEHTIGR
jgi:hypothetical protein